MVWTHLVVLLIWGVGGLHPAIQKGVCTQEMPPLSVHSIPIPQHQRTLAFHPAVLLPSLIRGGTETKDECELSLKHACFQMIGEGILWEMAAAGGALLVLRQALLQGRVVDVSRTPD